MGNRIGVIHCLKDGQAYMEQWPMNKELNPLFPEMRIIRATRFGIRVMPAVAVIIILIQMVFHNEQALPQAIVTALFAISLPLQGIWWLGQRSNTHLPSSLVHWYQEIYHKVVETGFALEPLAVKPRYKELAKLLNRAFKQLDKSALERWF